jgi:hypothetical protein
MSVCVVKREMLPEPSWPVSATWWAPWTVTRPWLPRWLRSCDERHNPSFGVVFPMLGAVVVWRMRYRRDDDAEHLMSWHIWSGWEGLYVADCPICAEVLQDSGHPYDS